MLRCSSVAVAAISVLAGPVGAVDYRGIVEKVDADKGVIILKSGNGNAIAQAVARDFKLFDEMGHELPDGLKAKELKEGVRVTFKRVRDRGEEKPLIQTIFLGERKRRIVGDDRGQNSVGFKPLSEMTAADRYLGEDGGLYGGGQNEPPPEHRAAARRELARIVPLDQKGQPARDGRIVFLSIGFSNTTQEFAVFKSLADADPQKAPPVTIVDGAQGSMVMAAWADPRPRPMNRSSPWDVAVERLDKANVSPQQVQVAWIKLANPFPKGDLREHGRELQDDSRVVVQRAKLRFPNLRIVYLSSRIYAGHAGGRSADLNPEPYAYEGAFVVRWLIQEQIQGGPELNHDPGRGVVKAPLLLWGPYLWADGTTPRQDSLVWLRQDLGDVHPSESGKKKVAEQLLKFCKHDSYARSWFAGAAVDAGK